MKLAIKGTVPSKTGPTPYFLYLAVLLPFATGYYLSYLLRTINALIAEPLSIELGFGPTELGLLTATYFALMGAIQLPVGVLLDRYGPRRVQSTCLLLGAVGATVFALGNDLATLMLGRALIGIGVGTAFMAGLKAIVLWFPAERVPLANGLLVTLGGLGAVSATVPAQTIIDLVGWRGLFLIIGWLSVASAMLIFLVVPEHIRPNSPAALTVTLSAIFQDRRFWKLAPMSAMTIGTAWALQGLWAAPWLSAVENFDRSAVVFTLFLMALSLSAAGLGLGFLASQLHKFGITTETVFGSVVAVFLLAQLCLITRMPIPPTILWLLIGAVGAGTVLAYAILPTYFSKEASGRANAALNLLHVGAAFSVQWTIGIVIDLWPSVNGRHPVEAYQFAFGANLIVQLFALAWFVSPSIKLNHLARRRRVNIPLTLHAHQIPKPHCSYRAARQDWLARTRDARAQADCWMAAAMMSMTLWVVLVTLVAPSFAINFTGSQPSFQNGQTIWSNSVATGVRFAEPLAATISTLPAHGSVREMRIGGSDGRPIDK